MRNTRCDDFSGVKRRPHGALSMHRGGIEKAEQNGEVNDEGKGVFHGKFFGVVVRSRAQKSIDLLREVLHHSREGLHRHHALPSVQKFSMGRVSGAANDSQHHPILH